MNTLFRKADCSAFLHCCGLLCLLLGGVGTAAADEALTLRAAVEATLAANPQLRVYEFRQWVLRGEALTAALKPPLQVNSNIEDALGSGDLSGFRQAELTLSLSQVVELGEQRSARIGVNSQRMALLDAEQRITELDLLSEVTRRFIAVAAAQERLALKQRTTVLTQQTVEALVPLVNAGQSPASEQSRATAALARARLEESGASATLVAAKLELAGMWAAVTPDANGDFSVSADLRDPGTPGVLTDLLLALEDNPALRIFASEERLRAAELVEARAQQRGTVQWTAGIRHLREVKDTAFMVGATLPLGSRERAAGSIAVAEATLAGVAAERDVVLNRLRTQLSSLHLQLQQAITEVNTLRDEVLPALDTALTQTRTAYQSGRYSYLELVSAQHEYLDADMALIDAAEDAHLLRAEIERLSGAALPSTEKNP